MPSCVQYEAFPTAAGAAIRIFVMGDSCSATTDGGDLLMRGKFQIEVMSASIQFESFVEND
jgi:hypothetical protein